MVSSRIEGDLRLRPADRQGAVEGRSSAAATRPARGRWRGTVSCSCRRGLTRRSCSRSGPTDKGDVTASHVAWRVGKGVPQKPSILLVGDLIFMVNDTGIVGAVEAKTGEIVWRGRVDGTYSASPIACRRPDLRVQRGWQDHRASKPAASSRSWPRTSSRKASWRRRPLTAARSICGRARTSTHRRARYSPLRATTGSSRMARRAGK